MGRVSTFEFQKLLVYDYIADRRSCDQFKTNAQIRKYVIEVIYRVLFASAFLFLFDTHTHTHTLGFCGIYNIVIQDLLNRNIVN